MNDLQSWLVIQEANRIFGFDGWQRQTLVVRCVAQAERRIGRDQKPGWGVTYTARVRIASNTPTATAPNAPLDQSTIRALQGHLRSLLPPQLEAFALAFRRAFQVPADIPSISGLITQQRHQLWIQQYLQQQHQSQPQSQPQAGLA